MRESAIVALFVLAASAAAEGIDGTPSPPPGPGHGRAPAVLMVTGDELGRPYARQIADGLLGALSRAAPPPELFVEFFDEVRLGDRPGYRAEYLRWLEQKYGGRGIDVIVTTGTSALQLFAESGGGPWPAAPVVYGLYEDLTIDASGSLPDASGMVMQNPFPLTLETIKALVPGTRRVAIVSGTSAGERARLPAFVPRVRAAGLEPLVLSDLPMDELLARVGSLPEDTVPYLISYQVDAAGRTFTGHQPCQMVAAAANRPAFAMGIEDVGLGFLGGPVTSFEPAGRELARLALLRLAGKPAAKVVLPAAQHTRLVFDARQLERWGMSESRLPKGSTVQFRPPSLWRDHRAEVLTALGVGAALLLLVGAVLFERHRGREAQSALAASYGQLHDVAGRLVVAEEAERTRIARDIHDDIGQQVASLSIGLSAARTRASEPGVPLREELSSLQQQARKVAADLRRLSHDLHPGALEQLGLVEALRSRGDVVRAETGLDVRLEAAGDLSAVDGAVALCLYRVAQESLRNVAQHAQARSARVSLERRGERVTMQVSDDGRGFDPAASRPAGLGLVSLGERVRLLGGTLEIRSSETAGTTLLVSLPTGGTHEA